MPAGGQVVDPAGRARRQWRRSRIGPTCRPTTWKPEAGAVIESSHSGRKYAISGCPSRPPTGYSCPLRVRTSSGFTARRYCLPESRWRIPTVAKPGSSRIDRLTIPFSRKRVPPSALRWSAALDGALRIIQSSVEGGSGPDTGKARTANTSCGGSSRSWPCNLTSDAERTTKIRKEEPAHGNFPAIQVS
jgi:hypothetical protein